MESRNFIKNKRGIIYYDSENYTITESNFYNEFTFYTLEKSKMTIVQFKQVITSLYINYIKAYPELFTDDYNVTSNILKYCHDIYYGRSKKEVKRDIALKVTISDYEQIGLDAWNSYKLKNK